MTSGVLLVGLGAIGMGYDLDSPSADRVRTHARAFQVQGMFRPIIAVDPDASRRRLFDEIYGGPSYGSLDEALSKHDPRVVVIATPTATHARVLSQLLDQATPLAILCEKPLAFDLEAAQAMVENCERRGVPLFVNYMRRCDPGVVGVRDMIRRGELQRPIKGVVWYSKGLLHNGSHFVDLLRFWFGPVQDSGIIRNGRLWEGEDPEPDFLLDFGGTTMLFVAAREECFSHYTVELLSSNGRLRYEEGGARIEWRGVINDPECAGYRVLKPVSL